MASRDETRTALLTFKFGNRRISLQFRLLSFVMFKGILPPRRIPSSEFIIVTPLAENGKENLPSSPARPEASPNGKAAAAVKSGKAAAQDKSKRRKGDVSHTAPTANSTDREFDRLLVRVLGD